MGISMRVLHINFSDYLHGGGGSVAVHRLCQGLRSVGVECTLLGKVKTLPSDQSGLIPRLRPLEGLIRRVGQSLGLNDIHTLGTFTLKHHAFFKSADILHLHVLHSDYFNYLAIPYLTADKPTVFTLHDMWAFTGHCAFSNDCDRWQIGCGHCPYPEAFPAIRRDATHLEWRLKQWIYQQTTLNLVTTSTWLTDRVKQSMLAKFPLHQIPYGLDTRIYQPLDQKECRTKLGIPLDKTVLMAAAVSFSDPRKGADLLIKALSQLSPALRAETVLLTIGNQTDRVGQTLGLPTISLGYLEDDHSKAVAYSAADLFLFPSRAETFGIVAQESMACGTPIVAFDVGGVSDVVRPGITGLLAQPEHVEAFTAQMTYLMENRHLRQSLAMKCREVAVSEYSLGQYARHHKTLYEAMLSGERCIEF